MRSDLLRKKKDENREWWQKAAGRRGDKHSGMLFTVTL